MDTSITGSELTHVTLGGDVTAPAISVPPVAARTRMLLEVPIVPTLLRLAARSCLDRIVPRYFVDTA
jgi:hypothetical protein